MTDPIAPSPGPSYRYTVKIKSNYPIQDLEFTIDLYDKTVYHVYQNAATDLVAALMAKIGQIFSEYDITGDLPATRAALDTLGVALKTDSVG